MSSIRKFGENITVARILLGAAGVCVGALGLCAVMTSEALVRVGVGGDDYQRIADGKAVLGDIQPPREYLIEPYLEANLILNGEGALEAHKARLAELRKTFEERRAYWRASPLPEPFKHEVVEVAGGEADAVWRELDAEFLPAAATEDRARLAQSFQRVSQHYLAHRAVIDDIASKTASFVDETELGAVQETKEIGWSMAAVFGVLILVFAGGVLALRQKLAARISVVAERLAVLAAKTSRSAEATKAQMRLDANISALRSALYERGAPRLVGDQLYFGDYLINGETTIVDGVRGRFGGAVTIFARDARVATNVLNDSGGRATGTRLAGGAAHDALFRKGATFQGETEILGRNYVAIYEPLLVDDHAIGAIFVGVPLEEASAEACAARNEVARMLEAVATIDAAVEAKSGLEREAIADRYQAGDQSRRASARAAAAAADQKLVVASLTKALQRLADNDLTHRIEADLPSEYRSLKRDFELAVGTLSGAIGAVVAQGETILGVSARITENSDVLARGSAQQATSLEEAVAALKEITASSTRSAEGAEHARVVVADADADAARSAQIVNEAVAAMHVIADSAGKITQIVGLIDEIALQTNLLALNAGVEAARAGDAGRGFAVVATEVRALALRSSEAAKNIRGLIATSTGEVKRGVELVSRTGEALKRIVEQVASLNAIVGGIAHGSKEQATGLGEINSAINLMDHGTHENATIAQQSAEAARTLESEAERLRALVSQFHLPAQGAASRAWAA